MLNFLKSEPDLKAFLSYAKNTVTAVTRLPSASNNDYRGKMQKLPLVTLFTAVTEKDEQKQCSNQVTAVTAKNSNVKIDKNDWLDLFEERAAIYQFEGGDNQTTAEAKAFDECILKLLNLDKKHTLTTAVKYLMACGLHNPFYKKEYQL